MSCCENRLCSTELFTYVPPSHLGKEDRRFAAPIGLIPQWGRHPAGRSWMYHTQIVFIVWWSPLGDENSAYNDFFATARFSVSLVFVDSVRV
jgi:hypothetical protein